MAQTLYNVVELPTDVAGRLVRVDLPGRSFEVLRAPALAHATIRMGSASADPLQLIEVSGSSSDCGFEAVWLSWDAVPGDAIRLVVGANCTVTRRALGQDSGANVVQLQGSTSLAGGTLALGAVAVALPGVSCVEVMVQADPTNADDVLVGGAGAQPIRLKPGQTFALQVQHTSLVYLKAASGAPVVNYLARS